MLVHQRRKKTRPAGSSGSRHDLAAWPVAGTLSSAGRGASTRRCFSGSEAAPRRRPSCSIAGAIVALLSAAPAAARRLRALATSTLDGGRLASRRSPAAAVAARSAPHAMNGGTTQNSRRSTAQLWLEQNKSVDAMSLRRGLSSETLVPAADGASRRKRTKFTPPPPNDDPPADDRDGMDAPQPIGSA